ncbi:MAG: FAD-dependent thymidylate synthase [Anaerolineaceae bacterium]
MSDPFFRRIYLLDPRQLSPETIAVTFAKTSRSPASFSEIAAELSDEKSAQFNEKWVVGYGHASVAEHAVLHIAIENVSRLAVETIESSRLASYTEKSSRYQKWDRQAFFIPPELEQHPLKSKFQELCWNLFDFYLECQPILQVHLAQELPRLEGENDSAYERRLCSSALDVARYLLPAAALANVGMTINARTLEHAISKMLSSALEEVRQIGTSIKDTAGNSIPTLIKYAAPSEYLAATACLKLNAASNPEKIKPPKDWLTLVDYNSPGVEKILASILYRQGDVDYENCYQKVFALSPDQKRALLEMIIGNRGSHDPLPREFEHTSYTFDVVMDQGAYYEIKRHRMMTQSPQELGVNLGYAIPRIFKNSGLLDRFQRLMDAAATTWTTLADWNPAVAAYVVPNGFNRRILISMNVREAYQFIKLRTAPNAHFAVRRVACRMAEEIQKAHPMLLSCFQTGDGETSQQIEQLYFTQAQS